MSMSPAAQTLKNKLESGYSLGPYRLLERLGYGGQAVVWSAWNQRSKRVVAIKFISGSGEPSQLDANVYLREQQIASALEHPNILPVYDIGVSGNFDYLVMRYICHGSLEDQLGKPVPVPEAIPLATQIAAALEYMHARGIVHRDLKPRNILLDSQKHVFLTDFGLARPLSGTTNPLHTGQGTAPYSPPEQHSRSQVTYASDIYSLGILLYEIFTGRLPWDGQTALAIRQMDVNDVLPDPRDLNPVLPESLAGALRRLTARDPAKRPGSVKNALNMVVGALQGYQTQQLRRALTLENLLEASTARLDDDAWAAADALFLLKEALDGWDPQTEPLTLSLTNFMLVDGMYEYAARHGREFTNAHHEVMLRGALTYNHNLPFWLDKVGDAAARVRICEQTIANEDEGAAARALDLIFEEPTAPPRSDSAYDALIDFSREATESRLRESALEVLERSGQTDTDWRKVSFSGGGDKKLADLALSDSPQAVHAARLIGRVHSETATQAILIARTDAQAARVLAVLMEVRDAAGSLPRSVPRLLRFQVGAEVARRQLLEEPESLAKAYLAAAVGSALGLGLHVYVTYRLPSFLDRARVLNALGSGLLFGALLGLGIFLTRLIASRLRVVSLLPRVVLGIVVGALMINLGIVSYHNLFLDAMPRGWLVGMGAVLMALGVGVGEAVSRSRLLRAALSAVTIALGLGLSWTLSLTSGLGPVIYYETNRPQETALLIAVTSLLMAGLAQLGDLRTKQEAS